MNRTHRIPRAHALVATAILLTTAVCQNREVIGLEGRPDNLGFDTIAVGRLSAARAVEWSNAGADTVTLSQLTVSGPAAADFVVAEDLCGGASLAPGESCSAVVLFGPREAGPRKATIAAGSGPGRTATVELRGEGIAETVATLEPAGLVRTVPETLDFGQQPLGATGGPLGVRLVNQRSGPVQFAVRLRGQTSEYRIALDRCSNEILAPGRACTVQVLFEPVVEGLRSGELILRDLNGPGIQTVPLSGMGVSAVTDGEAGAERLAASLGLSVSPRSVEFGVHEPGSASPVREVRIKNEGATNVVFRSLRIAGSDPDAFRISRNDCLSRALVPTRTCSLTIVFQPAASGTRTGRVEALTSAGLEPALVLLGGSGGSR